METLERISDQGMAGKRTREKMQIYFEFQITTSLPRVNSYRGIDLNLETVVAGLKTAHLSEITLGFEDLHHFHSRCLPFWV